VTRDEMVRKCNRNGRDKTITGLLQSSKLRKTRRDYGDFIDQARFRRKRAMKIDTMFRTKYSNQKRKQRKQFLVIIQLTKEPDARLNQMQN